MISKIQSIRSFGVFANYRWTAGLSPFKKFNLMFGWNYSGKTTLSRVFRCFERGEIHPDFLGAQAQLDLTDGKAVHFSNFHDAPQIRVFNSDFVADNLKFGDSTAIPVLVLGAEDIAKQKMLDDKVAERDALKVEIAKNVTRVQVSEDDTGKALTNAARDSIKNPLAVPGYDRTKFEPRVQECASNASSFLMSDAALQDSISVYGSSDKKPEVSEVSISLTSVRDLEGKVATLLAKVATAHTQIERLSGHPEIERWVDSGRALHEGKDECQFCGQSLPKDFLSSLNGHFSAEYDELMESLSLLLGAIRAAQAQEVAIEPKSAFYSELQSRHVAAAESLMRRLAARRKSLATLEQAVLSKQTKAFTPLVAPHVDDPSSEVAADVESLNQIVREHNARTAEFEVRRQTAFDRIEKHYAAQFAGEHQYNETKQQEKELRTLIATQRSAVSALEAEIRDLERALSEAVNGAESINKLLNICYGKSDISLEVAPDKRFRIVRAGAVAKNLSEGEKTALAFAYFITRVRDGRHKLSDIKVFIDDPISSLDSNHLFNTFALIKTQLADCQQVFVSTHSFEFYGLLREWASEDEKDLRKPQSDWKNWGIYLVRRKDNGEGEVAEIPNELLRFKSEYHYLFSMLYHFDKAGAGNFDGLLSLPNVVRRFMEAFGGIMIPRYAGLRGKLDRIFPEPIVRERVWKFINHYSHNTTITRSLTIPDTSECKAVVGACLKAVRDWDEDYFKDLEAEVQG